MTDALKAGLEALLFASRHPLSPEAAAEALQAEAAAVARALEDLHRDYANGQRGVHLVEVAGGWQIRTRAAFGACVERLLAGQRRSRLSRAALETLAAVAYNQPITKGEIDVLRGVDCSGALRTILDRDLVTVRGRSDRIGRPLLYATTPAFLEYFGLRSLDELPRLEDFAALADREAARQEIEASMSDEERDAGGDDADDDDTGAGRDEPGADRCGGYGDADRNDAHLEDHDGETEDPDPARAPDGT